jgi:hypothetical protein
MANAVLRAGVVRRIEQEYQPAGEAVTAMATVSREEANPLRRMLVPLIILVVLVAGALALNLLPWLRGLLGW